MLDSSAGDQRHPPTEQTPRQDSVPLADFAWSDLIVGIGFFPDEVLLPPGWSWET